MKLRIFLLFLLPALSFQAYSAADAEVESLEGSLRAQLEFVYPQTVRGAYHLDKGKEFSEFSLSASSITNSEAHTLIRQFKDEPEALSPFYTYLLGRVDVYLQKIKEVYAEGFAGDETYQSVLASIQSERERIEQARQNEDFFIHVRNFVEVYGLLFRALYLADDLSLRKHDGPSRDEPIKPFTERLLLRQSGSVFPYGGDCKTPKGEAWKVASSSMFTESLLRTHAEVEATQEFGHTTFYSLGRKFVDKHFGLCCTTLYCPGAKKFGLTTLVLAALQKHPASLVALPLGESGLMPAHDVLMSPLDFAAHDYFHALQNQAFYANIYRQIEKNARTLIYQGIHNKDAYLVAAKIASYRYNKLRQDLLFVLDKLAKEISSKEDQKNKLRYNIFLVSVFTLFHEEMFDVEAALSEVDSKLRLEKIFAHLVVETPSRPFEDLFLVDPVTGQSAHSFLASEADYNLNNASLRELLLKSKASPLDAKKSFKSLEEIVAEKRSPVDWEESSLFKTPFSLEVTLALESGERITRSILLSRGQFGLATEWNNLLKLVRKGVEAPQFEEQESVESKIEKIVDFFVRVRTAMKQNTEETLAMIKEAFPDAESASVEEEKLSAEVETAIASLAHIIGEEEARKTVLSKLEKKGGGSKEAKKAVGSEEASTTASIEESEKEFLLKALGDNPRRGREGNEEFLERITPILLKGN